MPLNGKSIFGVLIDVLKAMKRRLSRSRLGRGCSSFFQYHSLEMIHNHYDEIVERLRLKNQRGEKIKIAFFVSQNQLWCVDSLYREFSKKKNFEPEVIVFPNLEDRIKPAEVTCRENYDFFKIRNMNVTYGYDIRRKKFLDPAALKPDIVFYDQPVPFFPKKLLFDSVSKNALICYVPYGYKIANFYESHFNMELHNKCWKVFAESPWHKCQFERLGRMRGKNVVVSGYPKLDAYNEPNSSDFNWKSGSRKKGVVRIIWAPHWSISTTDLCYSTFDKYYMQFLDYAKKNPHVDWIFKPHQRLRYQCVVSRLMTETEVDRYYQEWDSLGNGMLYHGGNYFEIFKTSDALITDCGSFLAEYLPTRKPILHLTTGKSKGYNSIGELITKSYYKARTFSEIIDFIDTVVVGGNDYLLDQRIEALKNVMVNREGAGKFIADYFENIFVKNKYHETNRR